MGLRTKSANYAVSLESLVPTAGLLGDPDLKTLEESYFKSSTQACGWRSKLIDELEEKNRGLRHASPVKWRPIDDFSPGLPLMDLPEQVSETEEEVSMPTSGSSPR